MRRRRGPRQPRQLQELARLYGVQTSYRDAWGKRRRPSTEALVAILRALGAPLDDLGGLDEALKSRRAELRSQVLEPTVVAWEGEAPRIQLRLPGSRDGELIRCRVDLEAGGSRGWRLRLAAAGEELGEPLWTAELPEALPGGYHRLEVEHRGRSFASRLVAAPRRAFGGASAAGPGWGVFLPLYALHSRRSWGSGDLRDLEALMEWTAGIGGSLVGTLPLFASFLDEPCDPSPYAPASRLFWNELYADVERLPELEQSQPARRLLASDELRGAVARLRHAELVDYREQMRWKRRLLGELARAFFEGAGDGRRRAFDRFLRRRPEVEDYATFRAVVEGRRELWQSWPEALRRGRLPAAEVDEAARRYHLYVQWTMAEQLAGLQDKRRRDGVGLYLDLPLGCHPSSYDTWRHAELFAHEISAGAPPDGFFTQGQVWGFPPLLPATLAAAGLEHFVTVVRNILAHAALVRVDHAMQLHRLFWVPDGATAAEGTYVRYPVEVLYAVLCLESQRATTAVVGEDLGTVPAVVRRRLGRHGIYRMYVVQYELEGGDQRPLSAIPARCLATLNTHDMPTFGSFWQAADLDLRHRLGLLDATARGREAEARKALKASVVRRLVARGRLEDPAPETPAVLRGILAELAASRAHYVLVNLEDLWLEPRAQNVPGTGDEHPNWRRRARLSLEELSWRPEVVDTLEAIHALRRGGS